MNKLITVFLIIGSLFSVALVSYLLVHPSLPISAFSTYGIAQSSGSLVLVDTIDDGIDYLDVAEPVNKGDELIRQCYEYRGYTLCEPFKRNNEQHY